MVSSPARPNLIVLGADGLRWGGEKGRPSDRDDEAKRLRGLVSGEAFLNISAKVHTLST
jgi:hypothetical protein